MAVDDERARGVGCAGAGAGRGRRSRRSHAEGPKRATTRIEPGDEDSEGLYQDELDAGLAQDLEARLAAVERAEARLAAGTYGLSTVSGEPIPDERLEAQPTAELTVEEEERRPRSE